MSNKSLGRIYLDTQDDVLQLVSLNASNDGDIYIATPLGGYPTQNGLIANQKFSYHASGKMHMTTELDLGKLGPADKKFFGTTATETLSGTKIYASGNKIYLNGFDSGPPISEIKDLVKTRFGTSLKDVATINANNTMLAPALNKSKINSAYIIDSSKYKSLTLRAYLAPSDFKLTPFNLDGRDTRLEQFEFKLPKHDVKVIMIAADEWAGEKDEKRS